MHTSDCEPNRVADELANQGRLMPEVEGDAPKTPWSLIKSDLVRQVNKYWSFKWMQQGTCRQSKDFFPEVDISRSFDIIGLSRKQWARVIGLFTGHNGMGRHVFLCSDPNDLESTPPTCPKCEEDDETSKHIMGYCPALHMLRRELFKESFIDPPFDDLRISKVLTFMTRSQIPALQWKPPQQADTTTQ